MNEPLRELPDSGFAGDDGSAPAAVTEALAAYGADAAEPGALHHTTLAVLQDIRVLVPVVAVLGEVEHELAGDKTGDKASAMAAVLTTGADGRTALLAFTGTATLTAWGPGARPVPVGIRQAAQAAIQQEAAALLLDLAGPVLFVIEDADLAELAAGSTLVELADGWGWARSS